MAASELPAALVWSPTLANHDPDPPLAPEDSVFGDASWFSSGSGAAEFSSGAEANSAWFSSGESQPQFYGYASVPVEAQWFSSGDNVGTFNGFFDTITISAAWLASGDNGGRGQAQFYGERAYTARCEGAFTYDPLGGPEWDGTLRREPEIIVQQQVSDSPSVSTFTDEDEPALGQNVQLDMNDGHGVIMGGTVQSYTTRYEGQPDDGTGPNDHLVHDVNVADYLFLLNKRRPFACYTNQPADVVAQDLRTRFAPPDFSGAGIVAGLPNITVTFDGTLDYSGCMSVVAARIAGHYRVDKDKVIHLFQDDPTPGPDVIDDNNQLLLRDQPLTITRDISQLRNRVFVKGASAKLLADSAIGATELEIDGLDMFSETGGEAIIGCDRFTYAGVAKTLIYPPPDASLMVPPVITGQQYVAPGNLYLDGPIRTHVRYSAAYVFNGKESPRSTPREVSLFDYNPGFSAPSVTFIPYGGFLPAGAHEWVLVFRSTGGGILYDVNIGDSGGGGFVMGAVEIVWNAGTSISNDLRIESVTLYRKATFPGGDPGPAGTSGGWYHAVETQPWNLAGTYTFFDGKADESLGNSLPWDEGLYTFQRYSTIGARVVLDTLTARNSATNNGAQQLKIYREEAFNGGNSWTEPQLCMTFDTTENITASDPLQTEDLKNTSAHLYALGEEATNTTVTPPAPKPKTRLILYGISGLDEAHFEGDDVSIFVQRDDLPSQIAMATIEGGDGLHEFMVVDTNLRSNAELIVRGDAELTLFKDPIITVNYSSFDSKHEPGGTVEFNLSRPPLVASLKITEVKIDKVHYQHGHVARYNVTASSVKFTLQDLLRRTILRPY